MLGSATLADLPDKPEFIFDATSLQSGDLWRFSKRAEGDWRVGTLPSPTTRLATVVAASSAFPPSFPRAHVLSFLGPATRRRPRSQLGSVHDTGRSCRRRRIRQPRAGSSLDDLRAGSDQRCRRPHGQQATSVGLWPLQILRVLSVIDNQVRDLRKRQAVLSLIDRQRTGAYWGIRSHVRDFRLADPIAEPSDATVRALAGVPTRLARVDNSLQERLINWGYVICDTALRAHVDPSQRPGSEPYPASGLGETRAVTTQRQ